MILNSKTEQFVPFFYTAAKMPISQLRVVGTKASSPLRRAVTGACPARWLLSSWDSCSNSPSHTPCRDHGLPSLQPPERTHGGRLQGKAPKATCQDASHPAPLGWRLCTQENHCLSPPGAGCRDLDEQNMTTCRVTYSLTWKCFRFILEGLRCI